MYSVIIHLHYLEKFSEILPGHSMDAEDYLRELAQHVLLEFFIAAAVDQVSIRTLPGPEEEDKRFSARITAHCSGKIYPGGSQGLALLELRVEDRLSCALQELVGMIEMEEVSIVDSSLQDERVLSYHS